MKGAGFMDVMTWWGPYVVGLLAIVYSAISKLRPGDDEEDDERAGWAVIAANAVAVVIGFLLVGLLAKPADVSWKLAMSFLIGGLAGVLSLAWSRWHASTPSSKVFFGYGIALLAMAFLRNYFRDAPMLYVLVASLGCWLVAAIVTYGGVRASGVRTAALLATVLAAGVALGLYHYPKSAMGSLYAIDLCALVMLLVLLGSMWRLSGRLVVIIRSVTGVALLALLWWLASLLGKHVLQDSRPGLCALVGASAALLNGFVAWAAQPNGDGRRLLGRGEAGALAVLVSVAAAAMSMRWLGGYGISLAAISGAVSAAFILGACECSREGRSEGFKSALATAAALAAVALVRVYLKASAGTSEEVDLFASYTIPGLALGGSLALMMAAVGRSNGAGLCACLRGAGVTVLAAAVVFAITYLWRGDAANGLVVGIAAGAFYALMSGFLCGRLDDSLVLTPGLLVLIVTLAPPFLDATWNLSRAQKIHALWWVIGVAAVLVIVTSSVRLILRGRPGESERSS